LASDNFFFIRVSFGRLFGLSFIAEEFIVRADKEQMVGVCSVVDGQVVGPIRVVRIPIIFARPPLLWLLFVTERGAFDAREAAMEFGVEFMEVRVFDEIVANLTTPSGQTRSMACRVCFGMWVLVRSSAAIHAVAIGQDRLYQIGYGTRD